MQLVHQPIALLLIDHEGEVQIVGRLAHQIDALFGEQLERLAELMQDGADVAPDQAHRGAGSNHLRTAQWRQIRDQLRRARS